MGSPIAPGRAKPPDIALLLDAACAGDRAAQGAVLTRYEPLFAAMARAHLGETGFPRDGEDLLQFVRLSVVLALPGLRGRSSASLGAWLRKLARCRILDWQKAQRSGGGDVRCERLATRDLEGIASCRTSASRRLLRKEAIEILDSAIERVPERYRPVLRALRDEGPPLGRLAAAMGKSPESTRKLVGRALVCLRSAVAATARRTGKTS